MKHSLVQSVHLPLGLARRLAARMAVLAVALLASTPAWAEYALNMPEGVTPFSAEVYELHMIIFLICVAIGVVVFGAMIYSMIRFRKSRGAVASTFSHSTKLEVLWTVIPFFILVAMAIPATKTLIFMEDTGDAELTVKVTGYQWMWGYEYMEEGVGFVSALDAESNRVRRLGSGLDPYEVEHYLLDVDNRLVLPTDTKVRFLLTSNDVIHSWWVPDFGWKRDAIPGVINEAWTIIEKPGVYRGQCTELCGKDHGFMPIVVEAVPRPEYEQWLVGMRNNDEVNLLVRKPNDAEPSTTPVAAAAQPAQIRQEAITEASIDG